MFKKAARRSSLFLLEIMISILMFSVASAWCVRLFVTARLVVDETEKQNKAQNLAAGYAELFLASADFDAFLLQEGAERKKGEKRITYHFGCDEDWNICGEADAPFVLDIMITEERDFEKCYFWFRRTDEKEDIYTLEIEKYTGGVAAL